MFSSFLLHFPSAYDPFKMNIECDEGRDCMERHIGAWHKESSPEHSEVGELLIDGNHLEFYGRFTASISPETFIGSDGQYGYKVFVNGPARVGNNKSLDFATSYRTCYVLMQNFGFSKGTDISGIQEFSFTIPELINWIGISTVYYAGTDQERLAAAEKSLAPITLKSSDPLIELYFESKTSESMSSLEDSTTITVKNEPRIRVLYKESVDVQKVYADIECIMEFFGLLIGKISVANDIRLTVEGQDLKSWLYINHDFSYNTTTQGIFYRPRTYYYVVADNLTSYFLKWREFFFDDGYSMLRRIYFSVNDQKEIFAEDVFVQYMRILDGYHTRAYGDAETERKIKEATKKATKVIKKQLFNDDNRPIFETAIQSVLPDWKYNSSNMNDISGWIASGYVARKPLSHRIKELDRDHFSIIENNAVDIEKQHQNLKDVEKLSDAEIIKLYYKELGETRNYYSHYKQDRTEVLNYSQMLFSINVLKALIIAIFLSHIEIDKDTSRKMLAFDNELDFATMFLRKPEEEPFLTPREWLKENSNKQEKCDHNLCSCFDKLINKTKLHRKSNGYLED